MPALGLPHNFLHGLSDFWTRFFADAPQLEALYDGSAMLIGQAYLDLLSNVLNVSLQDAPIFQKEYYKLILLREDQMAYRRGASSSDDRWEAPLTDGVVQFASLDNRVVEPTVSLQGGNDYDLSETTVRFKVDPTDPLHDGNPIAGFARRLVDVVTGGSFDDTARLVTDTWGATYGVYKGDTLRLLDISPDLTLQRKQADYDIILVRDRVLYVSEDTPLPSASTAQNYVILRVPAVPEVEFEAMTFIADVATLGHIRLDAGSVRVYAKRQSDGQDVVEDIDFIVDYEKGILYRTTTWSAASSNKINYTWRQEVHPSSGGSPPRFSQTGSILGTPLSGTAVTTRVFQIALWGPDALVDRRALANNFGSLVGITERSSESYRALLRGIFQLYLLGPVIERLESALNVILGLPVIRDDGETLVSVDYGQPDYNRVTTLRPATNTQASYDFPKSTPLRTDLVAGLSFVAFEPLTTAIRVTDYIQDPTWWHHVVLPPELFSTAGTAEYPSPIRRTVSPGYVKHVIGAEDNPKIGDPGLVIGADEEGNVPAFPGQPIYRKRLAFVLMDRYFKFHTFYVRFDPGVFADVNVARYARSFDDLQRLVISAKPAHTFVFVEPATAFLDEVDVVEDGWFQPPYQVGQDPDGPELFVNEADADPMHPYVHLGLFLGTSISSPPGGDDAVVFTNYYPQIGVNGWLIGDYFHYELATQVVNFPTPGLAVAIPGAPGAPRRGRFVQVYIDQLIGGLRLVENVDYTVDYANRTVTRLTAWTGVATVSVTYVQLNIGNVIDAPADPTLGDVPLLIGGIDAALSRANYDPAAIDWLGNLIPVTNHRDLSLVERALTITIT